MTEPLIGFRYMVKRNRHIARVTDEGWGAVHIAPICGGRGMVMVHSGLIGKTDAEAEDWKRSMVESANAVHLLPRFLMCSRCEKRAPKARIGTYPKTPREVSR